MDGFLANIQVKVSSSEEREQLVSLFETEDRVLTNGRASFNMVLTDVGFVSFDFVSKDAVALRAIINAVCKSLSVFEKMKKVN